MGFVPVASGEIRVLGMSVQEALKKNLVAYVPRRKRSTGTSPFSSRTS